MPKSPNSGFQFNTLDVSDDGNIHTVGMPEAREEELAVRNKKKFNEIRGTFEQMPDGSFEVRTL